jgi:hypothetical protein
MSFSLQLTPLKLAVRSGGTRLLQIQKVRVKMQTLKSEGKTAIDFESGGIDAIILKIFRNISCKYCLH